MQNKRAWTKKLKKVWHGIFKYNANDFQENILHQTEIALPHQAKCSWE